jgi:hypothetical protein
MCFGEIAKSILKSWFFAFSPDSNHFLVFQTIQHANHVLARKIVRFYESKHDFNNLTSYHCGCWSSQSLFYYKYNYHIASTINQ